MWKCEVVVCGVCGDRHVGTDVGGVFCKSDKKTAYICLCEHRFLPLNKPTVLYIWLKVLKSSFKKHWSIQQSQRNHQLCSTHPPQFNQTTPTWQHLCWFSDVTVFEKDLLCAIVDFSICECASDILSTSQLHTLQLSTLSDTVDRSRTILTFHKYLIIVLLIIK